MRVLYICTGNSFRSPVAEALTRRFHPGMEVESAGTDPAGDIAGNVRDLLEKEDALEYVKPSPDGVSQRALNEADLVVAMMPEHRNYLERNFDTSGTRVETWNVKDPVRPEVEPREVFERLKQQVVNL